MNTRHRCGATLAAVLLSMSLSPAATAAKSKPNTVITAVPLPATASAMSFDTLSSANGSALRPLATENATAAPCPHVHPGKSLTAQEACFLPDKAPAWSQAVFSATAIGPLAEEEPGSRLQPQEPFPGSEPATYSLVLAGIGLIVTIARRRM